MFCNQCGKELPEDCQFCPWCGADLSAPDSRSDQTPQSPAPQTRTPAAGIGQRAGGIRPSVVLIVVILLVLALLLGGKVLRKDAPSPAASGASAPAAPSVSQPAPESAASEAAVPSEQPTASTPSSSVPAQEEAASPLEGTPSLSSAAGYIVRHGSSLVKLFESPSISSTSLATLSMENDDVFYLFKEEDGWGYGVTMGQVGWCEMERLQPDPNGRSQTLPDFLAPELQCRYLQALTLYNSTRWGSNRRDFSTEIMIDGAPFCKTSMFGGRYQTYETLVNSLFTGSYRDTAFFAGHFKDQNGELYETSGDGGSIFAVDLQDYSFRLEQQTDTEISFTLVGNYNGYGQNTQTPGPYTKEWPIVMVKESDGQWRFTQFASALNGNLGFQ